MRRIPAAVALLVAAVALWPSRVAASCIPQSEAKLRAAAQVIFEGVVVGEGDPYDTDLGKALTMRFRVSSYEKGGGPEELDVSTGTYRQGETWIGFSNSINPSPGETWRIYGRYTADGVVENSACSGTRYLLSAEAVPLQIPAHPSTPWTHAAGALTVFVGVAFLALGKPKVPR